MLAGALLAADEGWRRYRSQAVFWLALALSLLILLGVFLADQHFPGQPRERFFRQAWDLWAIGGVFSLLAAWSLNGRPQRLRTVLVLALLGLLAAILRAVDWSDIGSYLGGRPLFGLGNGTGLYALAAMTGLLLLGARDTAITRLRGGRALLVALFAFFTAVLLVCQTRSAWLAAMLVLPATLLLLGRRRLRGGEWTRPGFVAAVAVLLLAATVLGLDTIRDRWLQEWTSIAMLWHGELDQLPRSSVSLRFWLWQAAVAALIERPLLGWGSGTAALLIEAASIPGAYRHFHNLYLQLGAELGLAGLSLFVAWIGAVAHGVLGARRCGDADEDMLLFLAMVGVAYLLIGVVEYQHNEAGQAFLILLGALALNVRRDAGVEFRTETREDAIRHAAAS